MYYFAKTTIVVQNFSEKLFLLINFNVEFIFELPLLHDLVHCSLDVRIF